jgi:hypothetical protein
VSEISPAERRRRVRELEAAMRELDRLDREHGLGAMPGTAARRRRPPSRRSPLVAVVLTTLLLAGSVAVVPGEPMTSVRHVLGLGQSRLLPAPDPAGGGGEYAFALTQPGSDEPVGWDPCEPIRFAVNPAGGPPGGRGLVERAVERTSAATGLAFADEGDTDRRPFAGGMSFFGRAEPVVIGWADAEEVAGLAGQVAGLGGGATEAGTTGRRYYVTGSVALDTDVFTATTMAERPRVVEAIVLHELAHVVGLDHVSEPMELMYGDNAGQVAYGPGDLEGLARLGSLPCR